MPNRNIAELLSKVTRFRDERDWQQFHTFKDLAMAMAIEVGELQELFLWKIESELEKNLEDDQFRARVSDELADVLAYLLLLADKAGIDPGEALNNKISKNSVKYPADKVRGDCRKYNEY